MKGGLIFFTANSFEHGTMKVKLHFQTLDFVALYSRDYSDIDSKKCNRCNGNKTDNEIKSINFTVIIFTTLPRNTLKGYSVTSNK